MRHPKGRNIPLSLPRRFIGDLLSAACQVPTVPVHRCMDLSEVVTARETASPRPSWCAIFLKAYGFVAASRPELRRSYLTFPSPHLYEHPQNVASVAVERHFGEEEAVFFGHLRAPEARSLLEIDAKLRQFKERPIESIGAFRQAMRVSSLPRPLRRLIWWIGLNVSGRKRAQLMGTFGLSVYGGLGAASLHPLSPLTTTLNYGVISPNGQVDVHLVYDHRVLDGASVARALQALEGVLHREIVAELRYLRSVDAA